MRSKFWIMCRHKPKIDLGRTKGLDLQDMRASNDTQLTAIPLFSDAPSQIQLGRISKRSQNLKSTARSMRLSRLQNFKQSSDQINLFDSPKDTQRKFNYNGLFKKLMPKISKEILKSNMTFVQPTLQTAEEEDHEPSEEGVLKEMMDDIKKSEDFRLIQQAAYRSNERTCDNIQLSKELKLFDQKSPKTEKERCFFQFQTDYIDNCRRYKVLPLPLLKKIKYDTLVLDNYQISSEISKAFGESMHLLGKHVTGAKLINNNMKDKDIADFLLGMLYNPIGTCLDKF